MRSTMTGTRESRLHWERTHGAHAGAAAQYGDWQFQAYAWQPGSFTAVAFNTETKETLTHGRLAREMGSMAAAKEWCERIYQRLRLDDQRRGIDRC